MTTYHIWINCYAGTSRNPGTCKIHKTYCDRGCFLELESDHPHEDFEKLRKDYVPLPCPIGGAKRYFASQPLENHPVNGFEVLTIKDLTQRKRSIDNLVRLEE
ncbi:MAG: hypothetical protein V2A62_03705 [Candidatus Woesearchaeota archaeon]